MKYARITQEGYLESTILSDIEIEQGYSKGLKPLRQCDNKPTATGLQGIEEYYEETETEIVSSFRIIENHPKVVAAEITRLQKALTADDYKIIKCHEYALAEEPLPYDIAELHSSREAMRAQINELQNLIR